MANAVPTGPFDAAAAEENYRAVQAEDAARAAFVPFACPCRCALYGQHKRRTTEGARRG